LRIRHLIFYLPPYTKFHHNSITGSDKNSDLGISLQRTDLEINQKSSELDPGLMQEEQGIKALGDGYFIFQLDEE